MKKNKIDILLLDKSVLPSEGINHLSELLTYQKDLKIILWVKDVAKNLTTAYSFAALIDDLTYTSSDFLVKENTDGGDVFLSYLFPYSLEDGLKKNQKLSENENFKFIEAMLENLDIEESNPVIIEYIFK